MRRRGPVDWFALRLVFRMVLMRRVASIRVSRERGLRGEPRFTVQFEGTL